MSIKLVIKNAQLGDWAHARYTPNSSLEVGFELYGPEGQRITDPNLLLQCAPNIQLTNHHFPANAPPRASHRVDGASRHWIDFGPSEGAFSVRAYCTSNPAISSTGGEAPLNFETSRGRFAHRTPTTTAITAKPRPAQSAGGGGGFGGLGYALVGGALVFGALALVVGTDGGGESCSGYSFRYTCTSRCGTPGMYTSGPYADQMACERALDDFKLAYMQMNAVATFGACECGSGRVVTGGPYEHPKPASRSWRSSPLLGIAASAVAVTTFLLTYRSKRTIIVTPWINAEGAGVGVTGGF
jgi:hypothetical protein